MAIIFASVILHSRQVRYKNDKSVETAINELYEKASHIPKVYLVGDYIKK